MSDIVSRLRDYSEGPTWHWAKVCDEAADEIERLRAITCKCVENRADAVRYRWLRSKAIKNTAWDVFGDGCGWTIGLHSKDSRMSLDAAIDAVMQAKEGA